jgi:hypothetical protein
MDNSKVNGLNVPPQAQTTIAQPLRARPLATERFSRVLVDDRGNDRGAAHGTPIPNLTPEGSQQNREYAYRRLSGTMTGSAMAALAKDMATDSANDRTRAHIDPTGVAISGSVWSQFAVATQERAMAASHTASSGELTQMLERMCSALYVGEQSVGTQRVVMALDHVLPGAAAEIVREGVHISIRLHARSEESYRSMASQRDALMRALSVNGDRRVEVSVIQGDERSLGDSHG